MSKFQTSGTFFFFLFFVFTVKEKKVVHPPLLRLDTASSILDKYSRKLKKPTETGTRGESLFFDDSDSCKSGKTRTVMSI